MTKLEVMNQLGLIIKEVFDTDSAVTETTSADDVDEWDSLTHISFIEEIEKKFKVKFALGELLDPKNVGEMADLVLKKLPK